MKKICNIYIFINQYQIYYIFKIKSQNANNKRITDYITWCVTNYGFSFHISISSNLVIL